ncbi:MAG: DNA replication and repair protein RecF [Mariprofundus sp.]|nr:DNA replication and repair protein RecF [Mariprofundus sp.]
MTASGTDFQLATPLTIEQVKVRHLRCHDALVWHISPGLNLITGANGSGKTSLLESVYLMAHGRSFRQSRSPFLVQHGQTSFMIQGQWRRFGPMHLTVAGRKGKTSVRLQGRDIQRRKDVSESFPVLVEAPQGRKIVDGSPGERRRWLDALMMICFQHTRIHYDRYLRAVMQRGRLLRRQVFSGEIDAWEQQIVQHGLQIVSVRGHLITEINALLLEEQVLTGDAVSMSVSMPDYSQTAWLERLKNKRSDDARVGSLRFGSHVDGINISFQEREIRSAGSRGQQKLAAIALKMAECTLWSRYRRLIPVILLDDCLEALDRCRQMRLFKRLQQSPAQILMTAPDGVDIDPHLDIHTQMLTQHGLCDYTCDVEVDQKLLAINKESINKTTMEEAA